MSLLSTFYIEKLRHRVTLKKVTMLALGFYRLGSWFRKCLLSADRLIGCAVLSSNWPAGFQLRDQLQRVVNTTIYDQFSCQLVPITLRGACHLESGVMTARDESVTAAHLRWGRFVWYNFCYNCFIRILSSGYVKTVPKSDSLALTTLRLP